MIELNLEFNVIWRLACAYEIDQVTWLLKWLKKYNNIPYANSSHDNNLTNNNLMWHKNKFSIQYSLTNLNLRMIANSVTKNMKVIEKRNNRTL